MPFIFLAILFCEYDGRPLNPECRRKIRHFFFGMRSGMIFSFYTSAPCFFLFIRDHHSAHFYSSPHYSNQFFFHGGGLSQAPNKIEKILSEKRSGASPLLSNLYRSTSLRHISQWMGGEC